MCCGKGKKKCSCKKYCFAECNTITNAVINENGDLIITISDGTQYNAGNISFASTPVQVLFSVNPLMDSYTANDFGNDASFATGSVEQIPVCEYLMNGSQIPKVGDYITVRAKVSFRRNGDGNQAMVFYMTTDALNANSSVFGVSTPNSIARIDIIMNMVIKRINVYDSVNPTNALFYIHYTIEGFPEPSAIQYQGQDELVGITTYHQNLVIRPSVLSGSNSRVIIEDFTITKFLTP